MSEEIKVKEKWRRDPKLRIRSDGTGAGTCVERDGRAVKDLASVSWSVHGREGKARVILGYRGDTRFVEARADDHRDVAIDVRGEEVGRTGKSPVEPLCRALATDREYLMGWHANIAVCVRDELPESLGYSEAWRIGQRVARRFISVLFADRDDAPEPISDDEVRGGTSERADKRAT